jgi:hypothetical protein
MMNKIYIGNTQQHFKMRMRGHFQDIKQLVEKGVHSDSYAQHFACIWPRGANVPSSGMQCNLIKCEILWQGNPISVVKTFEKTPVLFATENEWRSLRSPEQPPIYLSILVWKYMACAATNPDSIGSTNRNSPVLMITRSVKSRLGGPKPNQKKNSLY